MFINHYSVPYISNDFSAFRGRRIELFLIAFNYRILINRMQVRFYFKSLLSKKPFLCSREKIADIENSAWRVIRICGRRGLRLMRI